MPENQSVEVTVKLSVWDLYRFQVSQMLSRLWYLLVIPGLVFGLAVLALIAEQLAGPRPGHAHQGGLILLNALPLLGVFFLLFLVAPYFSAVSSSKNPNLSGEIRYIFSADGVTCRGQYSQADIKWPAFVRAKELKWAFLLYPHKRIAHIILKRGIQSEEDLSYLRETLRQNIAKAKLRS